MLTPEHACVPSVRFSGILPCSGVRQNDPRAHLVTNDVTWYPILHLLSHDPTCCLMITYGAVPNGHGQVLRTWVISSLGRPNMRLS